MENIDDMLSASRDLTWNLTLASEQDKRWSPDVCHHLLVMSAQVGAVMNSLKRLKAEYGGEHV